MGILLAFVASLAIAIFYGGYATATLWGWFVVPLGIAPITYLHAVGLGCVLSSFLGQRGLNTDRWKGKDKATLIGEMLGLVIVAPTTLLIFGWAIHKFM